MKDARLDPSNPAYYKSTITGLLRAAKKHGLNIALKNGPDGAKIIFENEKGCSSVNVLRQNDSEEGKSHADH